MNILITGAAGFIGYHVTKKLIKKKNFRIFGVDSLNNYYDVNLKKARLKSLYKLNKNKNFFFKKLNLNNSKLTRKIFVSKKIDVVINLAAQAGVRYSIKNPRSYFDNNILVFFNLISFCKEFKVKHLISASTSSVYGASVRMPFKASYNPANHPIQFYAATKKCNEIMAHSYSCIYNLPITIVRFFTVYGPWGRPDMSLFCFVKNIINKKEIKIFNRGNHSRDFTYIDDVVNGICLLIKKKPKKNRKWNAKEDLSSSLSPFKIVNLGNGKKVRLLKYVKIIEKILKIKAKIKFFKMQKGDIKDTNADIKETQKYINYKPKINIYEGVSKFIYWYKSFYKI
jgi:UDP-glucuronate 4-epimerase